MNYNFDYNTNICWRCACQFTKWIFVIFRWIFVDDGWKSIKSNTKIIFSTLLRMEISGNPNDWAIDNVSWSKLLCNFYPKKASLQKTPKNEGSYHPISIDIFLEFQLWS